MVLKWSRARKRYERQGLLVEEKGLELAEEECLADSEYRERRKERSALRRAELDKDYVHKFAKEFSEEAINLAVHAHIRHAAYELSDNEI